LEIGVFEEPKRVNLAQGRLFLGLLGHFPNKALKGNALNSQV